MTRAKKLVEKTKKLREQVRIKVPTIKSRLDLLKEIPEIEDIVITAIENKVVDTPKEEVIEEFITKFKTVMRIDYRFPNKDMGLEAELPSGIINVSGLQPGNYVEVLEGELEGRSLEVIEILNSTTLRLDDVSIYDNIEEDIKVRFIFN